MKLCAECTFDLDGKTYEYEINADTKLATHKGTEIRPTIGPQSFNLMALTYKGDREKLNEDPSYPCNPKDFKVISVVRIKPLEEKEYSGDLKPIFALFYA